MWLVGAECCCEKMQQLRQYKAQELPTGVIAL